jgi:hypothetical protein
MRTNTRKLSAREAIARSYPGWDKALADRMIAWLDHCGYTIIEKDQPHDDATLVPAPQRAADRIERTR